MPLKFKIGADPEFSILRNGQRLHAQQTIRNLFCKELDAARSNVLQTKGGEFGYDGCAATGELRPKPALEPKKVTENIRACFEAFLTKGSFLDLSTLSLWAPIGGHIHLELPEGERERSHDEMAAPHKKLMSFYLPILLSEQKTDLRIRGQNYGKLSDYHTGEGKPTLEVRSPSAEWLTSERITRATLSYMSCVWHEIWEHPENLDKKILFKTGKQQAAIQELADSNFLSLTRGLLRAIGKNVRSFELYPQFKEDIEFILRPDRVLAEKKKYNFSIKDGWGFDTQKVKLNKRHFLKTPKNVDGKNLNLGLNHNDDLNTGSLVDEVAARVMGGLNLKYQYFFYGLKEDVPGHLISSNEAIFKAPQATSPEELERIQTTGRRMWEKAMDMLDVKGVLKLDFKHSKVIQEPVQVFAIGVPFAERKSKKFKPTLNLIWELEKNRLKAITPTVSPLQAGKDNVAAPLPLELEIGPGSDLMLDHDSQGRRFAEAAIREIQAEERRTENERAIFGETESREDHILIRAWRDGTELWWGGSHWELWERQNGAMNCTHRSANPIERDLWIDALNITQT
jgi:hypothetical protein